MTELAAAKPLTPGNLAGLSSKLMTVTDEMFVAVIDQLGPVTASPDVIQLLNELRPRLRRLRPLRPLSLKRLLCRPFEDLLTSDPAATEAATRIPRAEISACWGLLAAGADAELAALQARLARLSPDQPLPVYELACNLWEVAARTLGAPPPAEPTLVQSTPPRPPHLELVVETLAAASVIEQFKRELPDRPFGPIEDATAGLIISCARQLLGGGLPIRGFLLVVAARARSPSSLIELLARAGFGVPAGLDNFAVERLVEAAARFGDGIATTAPEALARDADEMLVSLTEMRNVVGEAARSGLARSGPEIETTVRAALGSRVIDPAPAALGAALEADASTDTLRTAESHARALRRSRRAAASVGLGEQAEQTIAAMQGRLEARIRDELQRTGGGLPSLGSGEGAALFRAIRMVELLSGPETARPHLLAAMSKSGKR
ncbi:MAG: hypothetical protein JO305_02800 [Alphaproteobacteria bacterium]|nr:hypothetical protein [Alphaproteobacteria bacterium]